MTKENLTVKNSTSIELPGNVGGYRFGNEKSFYTQIHLTYKPSWFHRTMMRVCFGLYWFDVN